MNTEELKGRGDRVLETWQKENQSRRIEERKLKKQIAKLEKDHNKALQSFKEEIQNFKDKDHNIVTNSRPFLPTSHENQGEHGVKEPPLPKPSQPAAGTQKWIAEHVDFDKLTGKNKNVLIDSIKTFMQRKNGIDPLRVWVQLTKGSLIIDAEVDDDPGNLAWPEDQEMATMIERATQATTTPEPPRGMPTMVERVEEIMDPWQSTRVDPWQHVEEDENERRSPYHSQDNEDSKEKGFRLVSEKDINFIKLHGEQDPNNKIPYMKCAKRLKEFIEPKGKEGIDLVYAMDWG